MTRWSVIRLVAGREVAERVGGRMLRISTVVLVLLVAAGVVVPSVVHRGPNTARIGLVGSARSLRATVLATAQATHQRVRVSDLADAASATTALTRGAVDVAVSLTGSGAQLEVDHSLTAATASVLGLALQVAHQREVLRGAGVAPATIRAAQRPLALATRVLHPPPRNQAARDLAALAAALVLYLALTLYGTAVASGVAQEKTSRTAEVLLACVRPSELLGGKVLGIGLCGLAQLAVAAAAGLIANAAVHSATIPSTVWALLPLTLLWFALGFTLFAFAFAAAGALVARQEEVQIVTGPLAMPLVVGYLLVYAVLGSPHATWVRVLSYLPPLAPSMMPARIGTGTVSWEGVVLAVALTLIAIIATAWLAAGIYQAALVRGGARLSWREALALPRRARPARGG